MYKLCFFVPTASLASVKQAIFETGAGEIGAYQNCSWQILGEGQFRPSGSAQPFIGKIGDLETVEEYKVEMVCAHHLIKAAVAALKNAHPYEEPAYDVIRLEEF
jgi:hypothetical protein